jgi:putative acetyltransferase
MDFTIAVDPPEAADVRALLERHLALMHEITPPDGVFALDVRGLLDPRVTFVGARRDGELLGVGALKELDPSHGELKSMHTAAAVRGQGVGRALLQHLLAVATDRRYLRVSLETGVMAAFAPARALYAAAGFRPCGPFGDYPDAATSVFMTLEL